jgi:hypothetical protein
MRRLTLILSDLYLPEDSVNAGFPRTHELPSLDWLLRFSESRSIEDWHAWLRAEVAGLEQQSSIAALASRPAGALARLDNVWLATPVHLEARLDHARLTDQGLLRIEEAERARWCEEFNRVFAPQYVLRDCGQRAFQLVGLDPADTPTVDPARLLGADIGPALPGARAPGVRRLWTEIEMWLHGSALNAAREKARQRRISALWLWGNEPGPVAAAAKDSAGFVCFGSDPLVEGLALRNGDPGGAASFSAVNHPAEHVLAEFAPLTGGPGESLDALERNWFAPARAALDGRRLEYVQIIANDRVFRVHAGQGWKFWRRRRNWLQSLA